MRLSDSTPDTAAQLSSEARKSSVTNYVSAISIHCHRGASIEERLDRLELNLSETITKTVAESSVKTTEDLAMTRRESSKKINELEEESKRTREMIGVLRQETQELKEEVEKIKQKQTQQPW